MKKALAWVTRVLDQTPRLTATSVYSHSGLPQLTVCSGYLFKTHVRANIPSDCRH